MRPTKEQIEAAHKLASTGTPEAVGYRLLIWPLESTKYMEAKEMEKFPLLAAQGMEVKTEHQKEREDKGTTYGIVCGIGPTAFDRLGEPWVKLGDVIVFAHYAGSRVEMPLGSGDWYHFMNDEDLRGRMV